jgi:hypothetical protein
VTIFLDAFAPLVPVIQRFFEEVLVMDPDPAVRENRLGLVQSIAALADGVADLSRLGRRSAKGENLSGSAANTGFISQNVYLFCASEGLAAWFFATDRPGLARVMNLRPTQKVLYCQAVGYPE